MMTVGFDTGAVAGRVLVKGGFGFDGTAVAMVCLLRDGTRRGAALVVGTEIYGTRVQFNEYEQVDSLTLIGRVSFFLSSDESLGAAGGLTATRGFLSTGFVALGGAGSISSRLIDCDVGAGRCTAATTTGAVDRTSPRRLSSTDFSAYSLI